MSEHIMQETLVISIVVNGFTKAGAKYGAEADVSLAESHCDIDDSEMCCKVTIVPTQCLVNITGFGNTNLEATCDLLSNLIKYLRNYKDSKTKGIIHNEDDSKEIVEDVFADNKDALARFLEDPFLKIN